jgi:hypothetical protein
MRIALIAAVFVVILATVSFGAPFTLEITNIKPAGTGTPTIPATHRIFKAYPGIEYNIRPAVVGGVYPFVYSLDTAPSGMGINSKTGEISWPSPTTSGSPHSCTVRVVDNESSEVTASWSVSVSTSGFIFVEADYSGTKTGSITQPYSTIAEVLTNTNSSNITDIVYLRGGNYSLETGGEKSLHDSPHNWIGYPGETVNIDAQGSYLRPWDQGIYMDSLNWIGVVDYGVMLWGGHDYATIRRTIFTDLTSSTSVNNNQGFIFATTGSGSSTGHGLTIQDCQFSDFTGGQAIGSLYSGSKTLIENNYIYDGGYSGPHAFATPIGVKQYNTRYTIRGNKIVLPNNATKFEIFNWESNPDDAEFSFK